MERIVEIVLYHHPYYTVPGVNGKLLSSVIAETMDEIPDSCLHRKGNGSMKMAFVIV